jgi:spore coat protein A, manganese oxidase
MLDRRSLLKLGLVSAPSLMGGMGSVAWSDGGANAPKSPSVKPFQVSLPLPGTHQPVATTDGDGKLVGGIIPDTPTEQAPRFADGLTTDYFVVRMEETLQQILPGQRTLVWTYGTGVAGDGTYPGRSFKARSNRRNVVRFDNFITTPIVGDIHLHGAHTAPQFDGFPDDGLPFGGHKFYTYDNDNDDFPATLWYHDHSLDFTGRNVYMGLAGFYPMVDALEDALRLPGHVADTSPDFDVPLVLQDRIFDANNQLFYNSFSHDGLIGDTFLVNGVVQPFFNVSRRKYRFRLLNGSNARIYQLTLSDGSPFDVVATEGGLFAAKVQTTSILIGMAERFEFIIDFAKYKGGAKLTLNNIMQQTNGRGPDGPDPRNPTPLVQFRVVDDGAVDNSEFPALLRNDQPVFNVKDAVAHRTFQFNRSQGAWQVNGRFFDPNRDDALVKQNTTEIWTLKNGGGGWWHPIHIHLIRLRILSRNGRPPVGVEAAGDKDTFLLQGGDEVQVITKFKVDENKHTGRFAFHCHNVEHEDMRMMAVMNIVK